MSLKPTRRRSGADMVTVSVKHHLSKDFVAKVVMDAVIDVEVEDPDGVTKSMVEEAVRNRLWDRGREWADYVMDHYDDDDLEAATAVVERLWPDWKD